MRITNPGTQCRFSSASGGWNESVLDKYVTPSLSVVDVAVKYSHKNRCRFIE